MRGSKRTSAASMPSALVPEMRPRYSAATPGSFAGARELHAVDELELREQRCALLAEERELRLRQRLFLRQRHGQGIPVLAVDAEFVVEMRAGREARHADVTDDLALAHVLADLLVRECGHVAVCG